MSSAENERLYAAFLAGVAAREAQDHCATLGVHHQTESYFEDFLSEETVISTEELHQLAAIVEAAREFLLPIEHDGPCVNYDDQNPDDYDPYDSCSRHLRASAERKERLAEALRQYDGEVDR